MHKPGFLFGKKKQKPSSSSSAPPPVPQQQPTTEYVSNRRTETDPNKELIRQTDRNMNRVKREMQRERMRLETEEKKLMTQIKQLGRQGRINEAKMLAKNLIQVRKAKERTFQADNRMNTINIQAKMAKTDQSMLQVMNGATNIMQNVNSLGMSGEKAQNMVMNYEMESEKYKLNQEMTDEVLDSVLSSGIEDLDSNTDDVLNSVLDEIGLEISAQGQQTPSIQPQQQIVQQQQQLQQMNDEDLSNRFHGLQNS